MNSGLIDEFRWRGLVAQMSDEDGLAEHLDTVPRTLYCGFDPTADSLHIGSLIPLLALRRFQLAGHRPILLLGGATGLIGDPSFRDDERQLNSTDVVAGWVAALRQQVERFLAFDGQNAAVICNNLDWTQNLGVIEFLRDVGKHFSVNAMIQRDSVKARLDREGQGISYTEFSYMLLQGMDFLELARRHDCSLQIGGSDQWGNIVSGMDLIRRNLARQAYAMTLPLVTKSDGNKFGKTATGTIWLDPRKTSPYSFYQFWLNTADADVGKFLRLFTFLSKEEIETLDDMSKTQPELRKSQHRLAEEVTELVHGAEALAAAKRISGGLFGGGLDSFTESDLAQLLQDGLASSSVSPGTGLLTVLAGSDLAKSIGEARKLVQGGGVRLNNVVVESPTAQIDFEDAFFGRFYLLRKGKKSFHLVVRQ